MSVCITLLSTEDSNSGLDALHCCQLNKAIFWVVLHWYLLKTDRNMFWMYNCIATSIYWRWQFFGLYVLDTFHCSFKAAICWVVLQLYLKIELCPRRIALLSTEDGNMSGCITPLPTEDTNMSWMHYVAIYWRSEYDYVGLYNTSIYTDDGNMSYTFHDFYTEDFNKAWKSGLPGHHYC
jgi:hypothetical protein